MSSLLKVVCIHPTCPCGQIPCGQLDLFEEGDAILDPGPVSNIFYTSPLAAVLQGDCRDALTDFAENSVDSIVTDPPYALTGNGKGGFMGQEWDGKIPGVPYWKSAFRVAKPGAYLLAFGGMRTHHRLMVAIEDAGWEIRDCILWVYGQGMPHGLDVARAIDEHLGVERTEVGVQKQSGAKFKLTQELIDNGGFNDPNRKEFVLTKATSWAAQQWDGFGTAIKPAAEILVLARKPIEKGLTVAQNVLKWGVGGINIDDCRVPTSDPDALGRWPTNFTHDGSDEVLALLPDAPGQQGPAGGDSPSQKTHNVYGKMNRQGERSANKRYTENGGTNFANTPGQRRNDKGSAARFFWCPKASPKDRGNRPGFKNNHSTVKPTKLLEYLITMITPAGGTVLDMFAGSGSTLVAAKNLGFKSVGIELSTEYCEIIKTRLEEGETK